MNKNLIITILVIAAIIIIFILFANPLPKKEIEKSFKEILDTVKSIDIIIDSPYDSSNYEPSKVIEDKEEIYNITNLLKESNITDELFNTTFETGNFYYILILKTENEKNTQHIYITGDVVGINGKLATIDTQNIRQLDNIINKNVIGYGILQCEKETKNSTIVEKYYFKNNEIFHYSESKTYTPDDIKEIDDFITKINSYKGVSTLGNNIGEIKYSYLIDIDVEKISDKNYQEITKKAKDDLKNKTKEDIASENNDMICTYTFLEI